MNFAIPYISIWQLVCEIIFRLKSDYYWALHRIRNQTRELLHGKGETVSSKRLQNQAEGAFSDRRIYKYRVSSFYVWCTDYFSYPWLHLLLYGSLNKIKEVSFKYSNVVGERSWRILHRHSLCVFIQIGNLHKCLHVHTPCNKAT